MGVEHLARPVGERVEFQPARRTIELEAREPLPRRRLETLATGDRRIEIDQRLFERLHLADFAATVGVVRPAQLGRVLGFEFRGIGRSEEHTSELQSLMRSSYAVFCLK